MRLKRGNYPKLPLGVGKGNVDFGLLKPLYGVIADCKDWRETIRDFLAEEFFLAGLLPWVDRHSLGLNKGLTMDIAGDFEGPIHRTSIKAF